MSALAETYRRQARSFLLAGEPERSVELLKKAKAMCAKEPYLSVTILQDLCNACKMAGKIEDAGAYYLQLQALVGPPAADAAAPPAGRRRRRAGVLAGCAVGLLVAAIGGLAWRLERNSDLGTQRLVTVAPNLSRREKLLREDVGMVVVVGEYAGIAEGKHVRLELVIGTGSCFAMRTDGYLLTNKHVVELANAAPTALGDSGLNLVRVSYVVCFGPHPGDHLPAEVTASPRIDMAVLHVRRAFSDPFALAEQVPHQGEEALVAGYPGAVINVVNAQNINERRIRELRGRLEQTGYLNELETYNAETFVPQPNRGIVSVAHRRLQGIDYVQFDGVVGHGNSGGPLLNAHDQVIGMETLGLVAVEGQGNNRAISVDELRSELPRLLPQK